jgi:hypothetical protein
MLAAEEVLAGERWGGAICHDKRRGLQDLAFWGCQHWSLYFVALECIQLYALQVCKILATAVRRICSIACARCVNRQPCICRPRSCCWVGLPGTCCFGVVDVPQRCRTCAVQQC